MDTTENLVERLKLPPVSQIGVCVHNVDRAAEFYSKHFGIGPFNIYEFEAEKYWYKEQPQRLRARQGKAMLGTIELELVQPLIGDSCFGEFLKAHGEGMQHLGFNVPNYDEVFARLVESGFQPLLRVESYVPAYKGFLKASCFDTDKVGGVVFELLYKSWLMG